MGSADESCVGTKLLIGTCLPPVSPWALIAWLLPEPIALGAPSGPVGVCRGMSGALLRGRSVGIDTPPPKSYTLALIGFTRASGCVRSYSSFCSGVSTLSPSSTTISLCFPSWILILGIAICCILSELCNCCHELLTNLSPLVHAYVTLCIAYTQRPHTIYKISVGAVGDDIEYPGFACGFYLHNLA